MSDLRDQIAATVAEMPKPMPEDFSPDLWVDEAKICCSVRYPYDGTRSGAFALGFTLENDERINGRMMLQVRRSLWLALEYMRLGQTERLAGKGLLSPGIIIPPMRRERS